VAALLLHTPFTSHAVRAYVVFPSTLLVSPALLGFIKLLPMAGEQELLSTEIVNRGIENSGPYAGSLNFSVRVRRGLPDFLNSVNLKYVKLGYSYLLSPVFYFLTAPVLMVIFSAQIGKLFIWQDFCPKCDPIDALFIVGLLSLIIYIYLYLSPRSTYLVDFACYRPPNELKVINLCSSNLTKKKKKHVF
jgi:3-ketoacyl-CoA synthase